MIFVFFIPPKASRCQLVPAPQPGLLGRGLPQPGERVGRTETGSEQGSLGSEGKTGELRGCQSSAKAPRRLQWGVWPWPGRLRCQHRRVSWAW